MQAILGFVPHDALWSVEHLGGHFLTAMRGKTVQEDGMRCCAGHQRGVDLIQRKCESAVCLLFFLPHGCPDIGRDHVGASGGLTRVAHEMHLSRGQTRLQEAGVRVVALRARKIQPEAKMGRRFDPRIGHVVPIADPRHGLAAHISQMLLDREHVREDLTGMRQIGQTIDDRDSRVLRQRLHV